MASLALAAIVLAPTAWATSATPEQIYWDYAEHGKLTQPYSRAELGRALRDVAISGHGAPTVKQGVGLAIERAMEVTAARHVARRNGGLPFTSIDLGLMVFGSAVVLAFGAGLRRHGKREAYWQAQRLSVGADSADALPLP